MGHIVEHLVASHGVTNIRGFDLHDDGSYTVDYHWSTYRFLLFDGRTVDVRAVSDDSWLRGAVVKLLKLDEKHPIVGVATLAEPKPVPAKKTAARKAVAK